MALATSGALSVGTTAGANQNPKRSINEELGVAVTTPQSLANSTLRNLAGVSSGTISFSDFYGASAGANLIDIDTTGSSTSGTSVFRTYGTGYTTSTPNPILSGSPALSNGDSARFKITDNGGTLKVQFDCQVTVATSGSFPFLTTFTITGGTITNISAPSGASVNSSDNTKLDVPSGTFSYSTGTPTTVISITGSTPSGSTPSFITGSNTITFTAGSGSVPPNATGTEAENFKADKI
tara:strand:+ start:213 stop:926 length:714 start_codon:yes stop_codon:yes gene_type:complete